MPGRLSFLAIVPIIVLELELELVLDSLKAEEASFVHFAHTNNLPCRRKLLPRHPRPMKQRGVTNPAIDSWPS
jgi:hypothetical protein